MSKILYFVMLFCSTGVSLSENKNSGNVGEKAVFNGNQSQNLTGVKLISIENILRQGRVSYFKLRRGSDLLIKVWFGFYDQKRQFSTRHNTETKRPISKK